jgi:iron(III) transport system ATP-binding protein
MTSIHLDRISKVFGSARALDSIDLKIGEGELFFLLGPSGCGKSTLLRLIAGLFEPTSGRILFNGKDVTELRTSRRNAVMCFQSYALWPHMTVRQNVSFGLEIRGADAADLKSRVDEVLGLVQMEQYADRRPNQLSGGQQQRVALARALAVNPACLLLDEPLSNLDAKLRNEMRSEIRRICKTAGCTTIYVTHDQKEALSIADRIALLQSGKIVQLGTPSQLYHEPKTAFVADFIGNTNLLDGTIVSRNDQQLQIETAAGRFSAIAKGPLPDKVRLSVRPEQMRILREGATNGNLGNGNPGVNRVLGKPIETTFLGEASEHVLLVNGHRLRVVSTPPLFDVPETMTAEFDAADVVVLAE